MVSTSKLNSLFSIVISLMLIPTIPAIAQQPSPSNYFGTTTNLSYSYQLSFLQDPVSVKIAIVTNDNSTLTKSFSVSSQSGMVLLPKGTKSGIITFNIHHGKDQNPLGMLWTFTVDPDTNTVKPGAPINCDVESGMKCCIKGGNTFLFGAGC